MNTSIRTFTAAALVASVALVSATADTINASLFSKTCTFTVTGYTGASTLVDFPVLVRLNEGANSPGGFKYNDCLSGGSDLRFADAVGNLLPHEIETWDPSGESLVWVKVPQLSGDSTQVVAYYGAAQGAAPAVAASDVWSKYVTVIHGGAGITDSSPSALTLTANAVTATADGGFIGGGMNKPAKNSKGVNVPSPYKNNLFTNNRQYSLSFWAKSPTASDSSTHVTVCGVASWNNASFLGLFEKGHGWSVAVSGTHHYTDGKGKLPANTWTHTVFSYDTEAGHLTSYSNGEMIYDNASVNKYTDTGVNFWTFGGYADTANNDNFTGDLDECRIYDGIMSADWAKAEYDSMTVASFVSAGSVEDVDASAPALSIDVTRGYFDLSISAEVMSFGADGSSCDLHLTLADNDSFANPLAAFSRTAAQVALDTPYLIEAASLAAGTTYYLHVVMTNDKGVTSDKVLTVDTKAVPPCSISLEKEKTDSTLASFFWNLADFGTDSTYASLDIQYSSSDSFATCEELSISEQIDEAPASGRVVVRDLNSSSSYWFRLKAVNSLGGVTYTAAQSVTTTASDANTLTWANTGADLNAASSYVENRAPTANDVIYFTEPASVQPYLSSSLTVKGVFFGRYDSSRTTADTDPTGYVFTGADGAVLTLAGSGNSNYTMNSLTEAGSAEFNVPILLSGNNPYFAANGIALDFKGPISTTQAFGQDVYTVTEGKDNTHIGLLRLSAANPDFKPKKIHVAGSTHLELHHPEAIIAVPDISTGHWGGTDYPHMYNTTGEPIVLDALLKFSAESYGLNAFYFEGSPFIMTNCEFAVSQRDNKARYFNADVQLKTIGGWDYNGNAFSKSGTNMLELVGSYYEASGIASHLQILQGMFYPHDLFGTVARDGRRCRINGDGANGTTTPYPTLGVDRDARIPVSNLGGISFGKDNERKGGGLSGMGGEVSVTLTDTNDNEIELVDNLKTPENSGYIAPYPWAFGHPSATGTLCLENDLSRSGDANIYVLQGAADVTARLKGNVKFLNGNVYKYGNGTLALEGGLEMSSGKQLRATDGGLLVNCDLSTGFEGTVHYNGGGWLGGTGTVKQFHFEAANSALRGGEFGHGTLTVDGTGTAFKFAGSCGIIVDITDEGTCGLLKFQGDLSKYSSNWSGHWVQINASKDAPRGKYKIMDWSEGTGTPTKMMTAEAYQDIRYDEENVKIARLFVEDSAMYLSFVPNSDKGTVIIFF